MQSAQRARLEAAIARAHKTVWQAADIAESQGLFGTQSDLYFILADLTKVGTALVQHKRPKMVLKDYGEQGSFPPTS